MSVLFTSGLHLGHKHVNFLEHNETGCNYKDLNYFNVNIEDNNYEFVKLDTLKGYFNEN